MKLQAKLDNYAFFFYIRSLIAEPKNFGVVNVNTCLLWSRPALIRNMEHCGATTRRDDDRLETHQCRSSKRSSHAEKLPYTPVSTVEKYGASLCSLSGLRYAKTPTAIAGLLKTKWIAKLNWFIRQISTGLIFGGQNVRP